MSAYRLRPCSRVCIDRSAPWHARFPASLRMRTEHGAHIRNMSDNTGKNRMDTPPVRLRGRERVLADTEK